MPHLGSNRRLKLGALLGLVLGLSALFIADAPPAHSASPAPDLLAPLDQAQLDRIGATLEWSLPAGATQVQVRVNPWEDDGPALNLILGAVDSLQIPQPPEWQGLLPDMTYTWAVRAADAPTPLPADHSAWGPWAERSFRTPAASSATISLHKPPRGSTVASVTPTLSWIDRRTEVFYYEVQISRDSSFGEGVLGQWASIHWGIAQTSQPGDPTAYTVPAAQSLEDNAPHYWRVRPRVQGDGQPVPWTSPGYFELVTAAGRVAPTPTPTSAPRSVAAGKLAFVSDRDGNTEIYTAQPDGSEVKRLTDDPAVDLTPQWSPNGDALAFGSNRTGKWEIYVADDSGVKRLTDNQAGLAPIAWSPDGSKIAFWHFVDDFPNTDIFVMNRDGSNVTRVTDNPFTDTSPTWSPDGKQIAFVATRDGNTEIYVMNSDGSNQRRLTRHRAADSRPAWSPDGTKIAFVSERIFYPQLYTIEVATGFQRRVTATLSDKYSLTWSPTDRLIAYSCGFRVCVVDDDGRPSLRFIAHFGYKPQWSPDGGKIAYICFEGICILDAATGKETVVPNTMPGDIGVAWSRR